MRAKHQKNLEALEKLLEKERKALLDGRLEKVEEIVNRKRQLVEKGVLKGVATAVVMRIQQQASQNQLLLEAAVRGLKSVSARLDEMRKGASGLNTYDNNGNRATLGRKDSHKLQHRA